MPAAQREVIEVLCRYERANAFVTGPPGCGKSALLRAVAPLPEAAAIGVRWIETAGEVWIWTREEPAVLRIPHLEELSLDADGGRGRILRIPEHAFPRGTP